MLIRSRVVAVVLTAGAAFALASCDKGPTRPGGGGGSSAVNRIEIVAPPEIAPGEGVQLRANAIKSDGSLENVTDRAQWTSGTSEIVQLSATGLATVGNRGEVFVTARFGGVSGTARIWVLPTGTFRLSGSVKEITFGVAGVSVTVVSGIGEGLTTETGADGAYALYGVSGSVRIRLKKPGYLEGVQEVNVTTHRTQDLEIVPERPRTDYRGTYTLTITAASRCWGSSGAFPEAAKRREYTARVAQDAARLTVTLSDANFIMMGDRGNSFVGSVDISDSIKFTISDTDFYYYYFGSPDIAERFDDTTLIVSGTVSARGTPALVSGPLNGYLLISSRSSFPFYPFSSSCISDAHGFVMKRR